jgi:hypothetical protein
VLCDRAAAHPQETICKRRNSKGKNLKNHTIVDFLPAGMIFDVLAGDLGHISPLMSPV